MPQTEIVMPRMGESVVEATIIKWVKNEGDKVNADETIVEIATDKVDSEIPAPAGGVLIKKLCKEGDVVAVGKPIAIISQGEMNAPMNGSASAPAPAKAPPDTKSREEIKTEWKEPVAQSSAQAPVRHASPGGKFYSPLVRSIAQKEGVSLAELEAIPGSGKEGRVTKTDILSYLPQRHANGAQAPAPAKATGTESSTTETAKAPLPVSADDEIIEMDRMRKIIAEHMVMSKRTSPHVSSFVETDVTSMVLWREKAKAAFEKREGEKLTFTPIFIEAIIKAIKDFPLVNVSVDGTRIIRHKRINIGMAVALPSGNLIVPVIRDADRMNLVGLTRAVNDLANRARKNKLVPDDTQGGTFTLTNVGTFGNIMGTPVINQPQVAILATGVIKKKPVVLETPVGDTIGIRQMTYLSLSFDHRVVDGAMGGSFLKRVSDYLESFDINRTI